MAHKVLYSKLFAPPKYLEMPAVSLEILSHGVSFLSSKRTEDGLLPDVYGFTPFPEGTIQLGEVVKKDTVIKILSEIKRKTAVCFARCAVPEEKTYTFKTHLPNLTPKEIHDVLGFKTEENVPLSAKEAVFDYDVISTSRRADGFDAVVSVTALKFVEEWQSLLKLAGLTPIFFSPESNSVARSVIRDANEQVIVIANIRETNIVFSLAISGVVCQTSSINFGSSTFTDLLAKYFKVTPAEALRIKREKLYSEGELNVEIFSYLINTISAIKDELYKFISYCNERQDIVGEVDRVILCGQDALIIGLDKYLALNLDMDVEVANVWVNNFNFDDYVPDISRPDSLNMAVVNGLSLF